MLSWILTILIVTIPSTLGMDERWNSKPDSEDILSPFQLIGDATNAPAFVLTNSPAPEEEFSEEEELSESVSPTTSTQTSLQPTVLVTTPLITATPQPLNDCKIENGFFGDLEGESSVAVEFVYEVEINSESEKSVEDVINELENTFADTVLPALFSNDCLPFDRRRRRRLNNVIGVSTLPPDEVIEDVQCQIELANTENPCYVIDSEFTAFITNTASESETRTTALNAIKKSASNGDFINDDIVKITIVQYEPDTANNNDNNNNEQVGTRGTDDGGLMGVTVYIAIAAVVVVVATAIIYRRRRRSSQSNADGDTTVMTPALMPSSPQDVETPSPRYDLRGVGEQ